MAPKQDPKPKFQEGEEQERGTVGTGVGRSVGRSVPEEETGPGLPAVMRISPLGLVSACSGMGLLLAPAC